MEQVGRDGFDRVAKTLDEVKQAVTKLDDRFEAHLHGDKAQPGLMTRLDRLEQNAERSRWVIRAVAGTVITLLVGAVWSLLR